MQDPAAETLIGTFKWTGSGDSVDWRSQKFNETPPIMVSVSSLSTSDSPRSSGMNLEHIRLLADTQTPFPPIIAHRPTMRVIDGIHRLYAAKLRNQETIPVRFFDGDEADAFVIAVRSNVSHGLPLPLADRKAAAARILASHPQWSNRLIASIAGLAAKTVAEIRGNRQADKSPRRTVGQDGRLRPIDSAEGRRIAGELMIENPSLSLRQVAQVAGISPETARDVRRRLRRGESPVLPRRRRPRTETGDSPKPRDTNVMNAPVTRFSIPNGRPVVQRLKADPALRFTETGRALLRLLDLHTISEDNWAKIIESLPAHCRESVVHAAHECAHIWKTFADRVNNTEWSSA